MIEEVAYAGWQRNVRLFDETIELVITLEVGPRILRCALLGGKNIFKEFPDQLGQAGETDWRIRGGHRFWTAPEADHSYALDNAPVVYRALEQDGIEIVSPEQTAFGWQKTLRVELLGAGRVRVTHLLKNISAQPIEVTPWALTVMDVAGVAVIPQPPFVPHPSEREPGTLLNNDDFQANRRMVLWKYTNLIDARYTLGTSFWRILQRTDMGATKFGLLYQNGWVAYQLEETVFAKKVPYEAGMIYPDDGVNFELFTNREILELETLAPAHPIPAGETRELVEDWKITRVAESLTDNDVARKFFVTL